MKLNSVHFAILLTSIIYLTNGDVLKHSLTFVIDDTSSMSDDIEGVKQKTNKVFDDVLSSKSNQIQDFVLVTFNDPGEPILRAKTTSREEFKHALAEIHVHGGGDCPERSMGGILKALEESAPNSELYVFTDASAKDHGRYNEVKAMSQRKSSQVTFLLTGMCVQNKADSQYIVYEDLAEVTGGEVFHIHKENVNKIIDFIIEKSKSAGTTLFKKIFKGDDQFQFNVDSNINNVMISTIGDVDEMSIVDSDGNQVLTDPVVDDGLVHVVKYSPKPGMYTVKVKTNKHTSVSVRASTKISFQHGFSRNSPTSISETATRPVSGKQSYLSILLNDKARDVKLVNSELRDEKDNVIMTIPLTRISFSGSQQFYVGPLINTPEKMFKVAIIGYTSRKERIERVGSILVEPQNSSELKRIDDRTPKASLINGNEVKVEGNLSLTLKCKVDAYPKPDIIWENEFGDKLSPEVETLDFPYDYISILEIEKVTKNETYYCKALNRVGTDQEQINVIVLSAVPKIDRNNSLLVQQKGSRTEIACKLLQGFPKPKVTWLYRKGPEDEYQPLEGVNEIIVLDDTQTYHGGSYRCVAENDLGKDSHEMELMVSYPPVIDSNVDEIVAAEGGVKRIPCHVEGVPLPVVRWFKNNRELRSDRKYSIFRDHTLRFQVTLDDIGNYSCVAKNELGSAERKVQLNVYKHVSINKPINSTLNIMKGSLLRLPCDAEGFPKPDLKWTFLSFDPKSSPKVMRFLPKTNELEFVKNVEDSDSGFYTCGASNGDSEANITYTIFVQDPPKITESNTRLNAVEGDLALRIPCKNTGIPTPTISWKRDGLNLVLSSDSQHIEDDGTLVIMKPKAGDSGNYICIAENESGRDEKPFIVTIELYPRAEYPISTTFVKEGETTDIKCDIPHKPTDYLRWYKDGEQFSSGELQLDDPQTESDGIYTCRVSNYNSSRNYHTRVKVHYKPRFTYEDIGEPIEFIEGGSATLDCDADGFPNPSVVWMLNGDLIDVTSLTYKINFMGNNDIGKYECNVFNEYGNIKRSFQIKVTACLIPLDYFSGQQPLMMTTALTWGSYKIISNRSKNKSFVAVPEEAPFVLSCLDNFFTNPYLKRKKNIKAKCIRDSTLLVDEKVIDFLDLKCYKEIKPFVKSTKMRCGTGVNTELLIVGYLLGRNLLKMYDVCIDKDKMITLYTRHDLDEYMSNSMPKEEPKYLDAKELPVDFDEMYSKQAYTLLGGFLRTNESCRFSKRQMVNPRDVPPGSQIATYTYLNVVPHWSCYNKNWEKMENKVRSLAQLLKLTVWTGTTDVIRSPYTTGIEIYFRNSLYEELVAPLYLWKVVQNFETAASVAIIQVNMPNIDPSEVRKYVKCRDVCNEIEWLRDGDWHDVSKGFTYCCKLDEFKKAFSNTDDLYDFTNLLKFAMPDDVPSLQ